MTSLSRLCCCLLLLFWFDGATAQTDISGQTASGAYYRFAVPTGWQPADGLVIWNHGFDFSAIGPVTDLGPLADIQLAEGFAVAASSYSLSGWALFNTTRDLREMVAAFEQQVGKPDSVYLTGGSMGGLVTAQAIERGGLGNVAGAYSLCGVTAGARAWDGALDLRLLYDEVCDGVPGAAIPGGADGYPLALQPDLENAGSLDTILAATIGAAVQACTGIALPAAARTSGQQQRLERLLTLTNIPEEFFATNMGYATIILADLIQQPDKLGGQRGIGNVGVDYGDMQINAAITRSPPDLLGGLKLREAYTPSGAVGGTKIVALHTDKDGLVVVENMTDYVSKVPVTNLTAGVVVENEPTHCGFTEAEVIAGWHQLLAWARDGQPQPTVNDLQSECLALLDGGQTTGPCRIDPNYSLTAFDARVRPRAETDFAVNSRISGAWYNTSRDGEGWLIEILANDTALIYGFTYPPSGQTNAEQTWLIGVGRVVENRIEIVDVQITAGASFGAAFDPDDVQRLPWGQLTLRFESCDRAAVHYSGPLEFTQGATELTPLTRLNDASCSEPQQPVPAGTAGLSGSWFNSLRSGEGWIVQMLDNDRVAVFWFTYSPQGEQAWVVGTGDLVDRTVQINDAQLTRGAAFGSDFRATDVERVPFGTFSLSFNNCDSGSVSYESTVSGYGSGTREISRLTSIDGFECTL